MSTHRDSGLFTRLGSFVDVFGSAVAVASAVEARREPKVRDLKTLGIDANAFRSINRL